MILTQRGTKILDIPIINSFAPHSLTNVTVNLDHTNRPRQLEKTVQGYVLQVYYISIILVLQLLIQVCL